MNNSCKIDTGDWVGSEMTGPEWTPYAQAIADHYPNQEPWFASVAVTLTKAGAEVPLASRTTRPYWYDVLILGMSATIDGLNLTGNRSIFVRITHQDLGIPWSVPNKIGFTPIGAVAGLGLGAIGLPITVSPTSIIRLPEAFFLPAHNRLKVEFTFLDASQAGPRTFPIILTFVGVKLSNDTPGFKAPQKITMPNGNEIEVGSRLPWFSTVPLGTYQSRSADDFQLGPNEQAAQFLPPTECDVEVHDAYSNCIANLGAGQSSFLIKLTDMGAHTYWTPAQALVLALFGQEGNVTPARPFMKPYLLKKGHRIQATVQNNTGATIESPVMALRGVRLCEY